MHTQHLSQLKAVVYGAAVGDALGVPFEFLHRGTFACEGMSAGGFHNMPLGTFSDDTSLLIATCDSIRATKGIDIHDMRAKFRQWCFEGCYSADCKVFDVGNATVTALDQGFGCSHEWSNGNGSLMRIAPLAFTDASDDQIREVSAITHAHPISTESCVVFVHILRHVLGGMPLQDTIAQSIPKDPHFAFMGTIDQLERDSMNSGGFVLHTLEAALWCALNTNSYRDCVLAAVNLGSDTDTTACVAGALAGAIYGYNAIPAEWIDQLRGKQVIDCCLFDAE